MFTRINESTIINRYLYDFSVALNNKGYIAGGNLYYYYTHGRFHAPSDLDIFTTSLENYNDLTEWAGKIFHLECITNRAATYFQNVFPEIPHIIQIIKPRLDMGIEEICNNFDLIPSMIFLNENREIYRVESEEILNKGKIHDPIQTAYRLLKYIQKYKIARDYPVSKIIESYTFISKLILEQPDRLKFTSNEYNF